MKKVPAVAFWPVDREASCFLGQLTCMHTQLTFHCLGVGTRSSGFPRPAIIN